MTELPDDIVELQRLAFGYFVVRTNGKNGLVANNIRENSPCSIAATGCLVKLDLVAEKDGFFADAAVTVNVGEVSTTADALVRCAESAFHHAASQGEKSKSWL